MDSGTNLVVDSGTNLVVDSGTKPVVDGNGGSVIVTWASITKIRKIN